MADSLFDQPATRVPLQLVQGGGGPSPQPNISNANLKTLTNGIVVRYVTPDIKEDIMNLKFIEGEQRLFDTHLRFNNPFIVKYITSTPSKKEGFYKFWEIYINEDGTDGFHRMTGRKASAMKRYLEEIWKGYETYLIEGALRYIQKKDDAKAFEVLYEPKGEATVFDMFFERIPVPSDTFPSVSESTKTVLDSVKGHFTSLQEKYDEFINIVDSNDTERMKTIGEILKVVIAEKDEIIKKLMEVEAEKKESNTNFVKESLIESISRYRKAADLSEKVILAFNKYNSAKSGKLPKKLIFIDLRKKYDFALNLIETPIQKEFAKVIKPLHKSVKRRFNKTRKL